LKSVLFKNSDFFHNQKEYFLIIGKSISAYSRVCALYSAVFLIIPGDIVKSSYCATHQYWVLRLYPQ